ncbi:sodium-dependent phosphate transport protein 2A isoform X1 [Hydra vulgaris]|uniref:sodium-dependent phosphate transport protein 2A isoform X1 n=2 Tax=Hydra vulgaris TaxID=6087 RepID=UPI001F5F6065|nr:sodium-dependent phosphate transport protein 2A-like isoform X1 [Hydra vulgaris]
MIGTAIYELTGTIKEVKVLKNTEEIDELENVTEKDPFAASNNLPINGKPWKGLKSKDKFKRVIKTFIKLASLIGLLYLFICSLSFLSSGFRLLGGKTAGKAFSSNNIITNPVAGLMIGVVATVLLQSSSTTTSIVVTMVASDLIKVSPAIPIIMGANIGTTVTNTIVSLSQISDKNQFRRAFAAATVHDAFNIITVLVLLPVEILSGYLFWLTKTIISTTSLSSDKSLDQQLLTKITDPFTNLIIQLDKNVIEGLAKGDMSFAEKSLIKKNCNKETKHLLMFNLTQKINNTLMINNTQNVVKNSTELANNTQIKHNKPCKFVFHNTGMSDSLVGVILLVSALVILCFCLVFIVKILNSLLRGQIANVIRKTFNANFPKPFSFLTGYFAILVGAGMTFLLQSSSIFTSTLTPLVGLGVLSIDRVYPLTLGSNVGTTATGILAALASPSDHLAPALQIALCHLFFNISGILLWYPLPLFRKVPLNMAKYLGNTTAEYRWFAFFYILVFFFVIPTFVFLLSIAGRAVFIGVMVPIASLLSFIFVVNILQSNKPSFLPHILRNWKWLPKMLRSLEPYDKMITKLCGKYQRKKNDACVEMS